MVHLTGKPFVGRVIESRSRLNTQRSSALFNPKTMLPMDPLWHARAGKYIMNACAFCGEIWWAGNFAEHMDHADMFARLHGIGVRRGQTGLGQRNAAGRTVWN